MPIEPLSQGESEHLASLENKLDRNSTAQGEIAVALYEIFRLKLYRGTHKTFENYVRVRWGISRGRGNNLKYFGHLLIQLGMDGERNLYPVEDKPRGEREARPLFRLPHDHRAAAWRKVVAEPGPRSPGTIAKALDAYASENGIVIKKRRRRSAKSADGLHENAAGALRTLRAALQAIELDGELEVHLDGIGARLTRSRSSSESAGVIAA